MEAAMDEATEQELRWFGNLCKRYAVGEDEDGNPAVVASAADNELITARSVARYLIEEHAPLWSETRLYVEHTLAGLLEFTAHLFEAHSLGEDYGWRIERVIDLETDTELSLRVTVSLH
jgi:hypothetical protein